MSETRARMRKEECVPGPLDVSGAPGSDDRVTGNLRGNQEDLLGVDPGVRPARREPRLPRRAGGRV